MAQTDKAHADEPKLRTAREALERLRRRTSSVRPTAKTLTARDLWLGFYADIQQRRLGKKFTAKIRAAVIALAGMYENLRDGLRQSAQYELLTCVCKFDRVILTTDTLSLRAILGIPGYVARNERRLWKQQYGFAQRISGAGSIREIVIEREPSAPWFAPYRITIIPRDETGLCEGDFRSLLEVLPCFRLRLLEVAWDFPGGCVVDLDYIRRFGVFGKTWLRPGNDPYHDKWGGVGSKIVRAYFKWDTFRFRIELELHVNFLLEHGISDIFDFHKLVPALISDHIDFAQFDDVKLVHALRRSRLTLDEKRAVLKRVRQKAQGSLWEARRYLSRNAHLTNVHRLLVPVPEMNQVIRLALQKLVAQWPVHPARLGKTP